MKITSKHIHDIKKYYGYSTEDLTTYIGCTLSQMKAWESGKKRIPVGNYQKRIERFLADMPSNGEPEQSIEAYDELLMGSQKGYPPNVLNIEYIDAVRKKYLYSYADMDSKLEQGNGTYMSWIRRKNIPVTQIKKVCDLFNIQIMLPDIPSSKRFRAEKGLTKLALAELLGVDDTTVGAWEREGAKLPKPAWEKFVQLWGETFPSVEAKGESDAKTLVHALREELGMTQSEFGELFGVHHTTISLWELGKCSPMGKNKQLLKEYLAEVFG